MVVRHSYTRSSGAAKQAIKYYQLRPRGKHEEARSIFTSTGTVSRSEAISTINSHQHGNYLVHRLTISPSPEERPADLREMTRYVMSEWEKERGQSLHWVAVEHHNTEHPHVHVVIAGTGERESDGATRTVSIRRDDYSRIKAIGAEYCHSVNRTSQRWEEQTREHTPSADERQRQAYPPAGREVPDR